MGTYLLGVRVDVFEVLEERRGLLLRFLGVGPETVVRHDMCLCVLLDSTSESTDTLLYLQRQGVSVIVDMYESSCSPM